jgi:excinuclease ABC subunit A
MAASFIHLMRCRQHNLKNFSLKIPKQAITVLTGVSGSGKSSLAFDILFAEGQRRYLEYLSSQTRSWIKQLPKPAVDLIEGLSPTLAVGQRRYTLSSRGTIATYTDIYDFLSLLYSSSGEQHSPVTGKRLVRYSRQEIIDKLLKKYPSDTRLQLLAPIKLQRESPYAAITRLQQLGFIRLKINHQEWISEDPLLPENEIAHLEVVVDRLEMKEDSRERLASSVETAMDLSQGILKVMEGREGPVEYWTEIYVCPETNFAFAPLEPVDFNFNSARGACPTCQGLGGQVEVDPHALVFNPLLSLGEQVRTILNFLPKKISSHFLPLYEAFLKSQKVAEDTLVKHLPKKFLIHFLQESSESLTFTLVLNEEKKQVQTTWQGFIPFLNRVLHDNKVKDTLDELPFVQWQQCPTCQGMRLKPESLACLIKGKNISELCQLTVTDLIKTVNQWKFKGKAQKVAEEILPQLQQRLHFLEQVGLGYLQLNRPGKTLSDGETQRIQLASQIGAQLSGLIYILDEPSLGLHRQDIKYLQQVIERLKQLGNTIVMVEHERQLIQLADHLVELGPGAGEQGGYLTFEGTYQEMLETPTSLTGQWLNGKKTFPKPPHRKTKKEWLTIIHATLHNLNNVSLKIPLGCLVGFCGVSGSGKSTLALDIIGHQIQRHLRGQSTTNISGFDSIHRLVLSEKQSDRLSSRSLPATYVNLMTPLRQLFAETRLAKARGYKASRFSLNKRGGRCEACEGLGVLKVNMQLMSDLEIPCEVCLGQRYNYETLQVTWENHNFADILNLTVQEATHLFRYISSIASPLELMQELGLGYLKLGQPSNTLSGGEIQRLRLVADLATRSQEQTLYILDEPSAGLHFEDIEKLVLILQRLVERGDSVLMIEHHLELLRQADWLIELGPGGGPLGGHLLFEGTAAQLTQAKTPTGLIFKLKSN